MKKAVFKSINNKNFTVEYISEFMEGYLICQKIKT